MILRILDEAENDLIDGHAFYEAREKNLGNYFLDTIFSEIDSLRFYAGIHAVFFEKYHRLVCRKFPFAVYYTKDSQTVSIWAIVDCRRSPSWIRKRLK